jgi:hypothetical protein
MAALAFSKEKKIVVPASYENMKSYLFYRVDQHLNVRAATSSV